MNAVEQISGTGRILMEFPSVAAAAREFKVSPDNVSVICQKRCATDDGAQLRFKDENAITAKKLKIEQAKNTLTSVLTEGTDWRTLTDFSMYEICKEGVVRNKSTHNIMLHHQDGGYPSVALSAGSELKLRKLHVLLAQTFIPNPENLPVVHHVDECKYNYALSNLRWVTQRDNMIATLGKVVYQYDRDMELIMEWRCVKDVKRALGYSSGNISNACLGRIPSYKNCIWTYQKGVSPTMKRKQDQASSPLDPAPDPNNELP